MYKTILATILFSTALHAAPLPISNDTVPQLVEITDINNPVDRQMGDKFGFGRVEEPYAIGKTEVTNAQYAAFLNDVAKDDPNQLYDERMATHPRGGITRNGQAGSYTYAVIADRAQQPVVFVDLLDATRYCNWLSTGKTESGVYAIRQIERFDDVSIQPAMRDLNTAPGKRLYFLPNRNQWYKAAYYQPQTQSYRQYANVNVNQPSAYGTINQFDQAREWIETPYRQYRRSIGMSWDRIDDRFHDPNHWHPSRAHDGDDDLGFRVAATPVLQLIRTVNDKHNYFLQGHNAGKLQLRYDGHPTPAKLSYRITDYFNKTINQADLNITLKVGKQGVLDFMLPNVDGYYELSATIIVNDQTHRFNPLPMVVADKPVERPTDLMATSFGVTGHLGKFAYDYTTFSEPDETLELYRYAGITVNRMDGPWELVIDKTRDAGIQNLIVLSTMGWNYTLWESAASQQIVDKWAKLGVEEMYAGYAENIYQRVLKHKDLVPAWEMTNEPWGRHIVPEDYTQSVKVAVKATRMADPNAITLMGDTTFLGETLLASGAGALCDIQSFHVYSYFREYFWGIPTKLRHIRSVMNQYGMNGKPIWLTETSGCGYGIHIYPGQDLDEVRHYQAMDLPKKMVGSLAVGADKTFFYNFRTTPAHGTENEFGMVHTDLTPKPAFAAYRTIAKLFNTSRYVGQIDLPREYLGYVFEKAGQKHALIWLRDLQSNELSGKAAVLPDVLNQTQQLGFAAKGKVTQFNLMGTPTPLRIADGKVTFNVDGYPTSIVGDVAYPMLNVSSQKTDDVSQNKTASANLRILPPMPPTTSMRDLEKPSRLTASWATPSEMTVRLFNHADKPITGTLSLDVPDTWLPDSWHVLTKPQTVTLPAYGSATRVISYQPPHANPAGITQFLLTATLTLENGEVFADRAIVNIAKQQPYRHWQLPKADQAKGMTFENKLENGDADARLSWDESRGNWTEIYVYPAPKLAEKSLDELSPYTFNVRSKTPQQIQHINLRVRDASGEVFQYRFTPKLENADWHQVTYDIVNDKPKAKWGGNKDGKLDLPLTLQGIAFEFTRGDKVQEGSLELKAD
ncbi:MAG: hypothetical protein CMJ19_21340 [Phycisphaeraceae bacterium]|nr:hypothetical protein [Phycisphaeraceae bacterium]